MYNLRYLFVYLILILNLPLVAQTPEALKPFTETANGVKIEMVAIKGGTFMMGQPNPNLGGEEESDSEQPVHKVTISNFYLGKTEVTVAQFKAFIDATGYKTEAEKTGNSNSYKDGRWRFVNGLTWMSDVKGAKITEVTLNHPVIHVSWNDANAFCEWLSKNTQKKYRLPTEAEWEYAGRAIGAPAVKTDGQPFPQGSKIDNFAWYEENSNDATHPVGSKIPNSLGLYDMSGNVSEWCFDSFNAEYYATSPSVNPKGDTDGTDKAYRGGSWKDDANQCRVTCRNSYTPEYTSNNLGFRVALEL